MRDRNVGKEFVCSRKIYIWLFEHYRFVREFSSFSRISSLDVSEWFDQLIDIRSYWYSNLDKQSTLITIDIQINLVLKRSLDVIQLEYLEVDSDTRTIDFHSLPEHQLILTRYGTNNPTCFRFSIWARKAMIALALASFFVFAPFPIDCKLGKIGNVIYEKNPFPTKNKSLSTFHQASMIIFISIEFISWFCS